MTFSLTFFFGNEIKGPVYNALQYLDGSMNNTTHLDLVMQTNGWRRYNWNTLLSATERKQNQLQDEHISFSGKVRDNMGSLVQGATVSLIMRTRDSANQTSIAVTDKNGVFKEDGLIYSDSATLYYVVTKSKSLQQHVEIIPGKSLEYPGINVPVDTTMHYQALPGDVRRISSALNTENSNRKASSKEKILKEVVVKGKARSRLQLMDDKYAKLYKGTNGGRMFDIMSDSIAQRAPDFMEYLLRWKLPERVRRSNYVIYIDEVRIMPGTRRLLRAHEIAYVKFVPTDFTEPFASGIYIYTKTDEDYQRENETKYKTSMRQKKIPGYSAVKEFYHPDYSLPENKSITTTDIQTTVYWQPQLIIDKNNKVKITFYNNDISDKLKIIVVGINENGQMIYMEKLLER